MSQVVLGGVFKRFDVEGCVGSIRVCRWAILITGSLRPKTGRHYICTTEIHKNTKDDVETKQYMSYSEDSAADKQTESLTLHFLIKA